MACLKARPRKRSNRDIRNLPYNGAIEFCPCQFPSSLALDLVLPIPGTLTRMGDLTRQRRCSRRSARLITVLSIQVHRMGCHAMRTMQGKRHQFPIAHVNPTLPDCVLSHAPHAFISSEMDDDLEDVEGDMYDDDIFADLAVSSEPQEAEQGLQHCPVVAIMLTHHVNTSCDDMCAESIPQIVTLRLADGPVMPISHPSGDLHGQWIRLPGRLLPDGRRRWRGPGRGTGRVLLHGGRERWRRRRPVWRWNVSYTGAY